MEAEVIDLLWLKSFKDVLFYICEFQPAFDLHKIK